MKYLTGAVLLVFIPSLALAWGGPSPLPTDPVLQGQYQGDQAATAYSINKSLEGSSNAQAGLNSANDRISDLEKTKLFLEQDIRIYDGKYTTLAAFNMVDMTQAKEYGAGMRFTVKIGSSYEQRLLDKQQKQIDLLMDKLQQMGK